MKQFADSSTRGARYWVGFTLTFLALGVVFPAVLAFFALAHAFSFGAGASPAWWLLVYPVILGFLWLTRRADPADVLPRGLLRGALTGTLVPVLVLLYFGGLGLRYANVTGVLLWIGLLGSVFVALGVALVRRVRAHP